jgi:glycosyltransferase involved in cell wall biosynthesis
VRIAIDARKLFDGGIGTYIRGLLGALAAAPDGNRYVALTSPGDLGRTAWPRERVDLVPVRAGKYGIAEHFTVPRAARRAGVGLFHAPHYTLPLGWLGPAVVTIHDLIHLRYPQFFPPGAALYARAMAGSAAARARVVIADSAATRADVVERLGTPERKVRVIRLGVSAALSPPPAERVADYRRARDLPADYALYVGARKAHKNLGMLIDALGRIAAGSRPPLVLSGPPWAPDDPLARRAARGGVAVRFSGAIEGDGDLACLYGGAALLAQPSLIEGFGLPPLEAMACGTPVISSDAPALIETVGDAAVIVPARDAEAWGSAIAGLLADSPRREALRRRGLDRAREFTWEKTAAQTAEIYREAMEP